MSAGSRFLTKVLEGMRSAPRKYPLRTGAVIGGGTVVGVDALEPKTLPPSVEEVTPNAGSTIGKRSPDNGGDPRSPEPRTGDYQAPLWSAEDLSKLIEELYQYPEFRDILDPHLRHQQSLDQARVTGEEERALQAWKTWRDVETAKINANAAGQIALANTFYMASQPNVGHLDAYNRGTEAALAQLRPNATRPLGTTLSNIPSSVLRSPRSPLRLS